MSAIKRVLLMIGLSIFALCDTSSAQIYHNPSSFNTYWAYCRSIGGPTAGQIVYNCPVQLTAEPYPQTNAHFHTANQPKSAIHCTNDIQCAPRVGYVITGSTWVKGSIQFDLAATIIGQFEKISVAAADGGQTLDYRVGYSNLYYNDHPEIWVRIGGDETGGGTGHGSTHYNRYMKSDPAYKLFYSTHWYLDAHPEISKVCTNDMSLPFGGKFDIYQNWTGDHQQHSKGAAADVAGLTSSIQCPNAGGQKVDAYQFRQSCIDNGALAAYSFHHDGNHAHCGFEAP